MTRRQSNNQWSGSIAAHLAPKNSSAKIRWKSSRLDFFGIKTASSSLIIFQRVKLSTPSITHLYWCNWRTFWRKNAAGRSSRGSCSCTTMPRLTGHLQPRRNWPTWDSNVLITHPILRMWPRRTTTCSLDWKINWKVAIFRPTRRSFLPRRPGWTDKLLIFFSGLQTLEQRAKKCIELRGEYVEKIQSLVAVPCFLPGRPKYLPAPPRILVLSRSVPRKDGKTFVFGWKTATKPLVASCKGGIIRKRTRRRQSNRRSTRSSLSPFSSAMHCVVRSLWPLSTRNIKVIPVNTNTKVSDFVSRWLTHRHFSCFTGSPNTIFPIMSWLCASRFHGLWDFWGT